MKHAYTQRISRLTVQLAEGLGLGRQELIHIPLAARIFAIVDVYDALTSDRPYRQGWSQEAAIEHIRSERGRHFDPQVVDTFLTFME